jgi:hypothetical protein
MMMAGHVEGMGNGRNAHRILFGKTEAKRSLEDLLTD